MKGCFLKAWIILGVWAFSISGNAQTFGLPNTKKLQIGLNTSQYNFFDGNRFIQNYDGTLYYNIIQTRGSELIYFFNKNGIRLSYNKIKIEYILDITHPKPLGRLTHRRHNLYSLEYLRKVYTRKQLEIHLSTGLTYRTGYEGVITGYDLYGPYTEGIFANAFGLTIGSYLITSIYKGLNLNLGLKYTGFVYREYTGGQFYFEDDGSTKHMFGVTLGLGYTFNFKPKE